MKISLTSSSAGFGRSVEVANVGFVILQSQNMILAERPDWRSASGKNGLIVTIRHFQELSFTTGVTVSESAAGMGWNMQRVKHRH